jgi:N-acetylmuramoyl-L-alanine amidase
MEGVSDAPRFTRRHVLGSLAAAGALVRPASAVAGAIGPPVFSRRVGTLGGGPVSLAPGRGFSMVGVEWSDPAAIAIELRARSAPGPWGPWVRASVAGHDGDGRTSGSGSGSGLGLGLGLGLGSGLGSASAAVSVSASARFGEPLWVQRADQVQLRSSGPVSGVSVHFVAHTTAARGARPIASAAALPLAQPRLDAGPGQPPIIARSAWAPGRARPVAGPFYGSVNLAFVHHTDNPNGYSAEQVPALLLAIYDYHRFVRGFFDIAYNFIIDAFGRIWEARAGGIDAPVLGAHAGGFNGVSTGVAVLGTFSDVVPPAPAIAALERLLGWKLALHGIPSLGRVRVEVNPADAFYTPFKPGQQVLLPRVAGHRDGDLTDCPGDAFYHRLPAIRPRVARLEGVPAELTVSPGEVVTSPGDSVTLSGRLTRGGQAIAGAALTLQSLPAARALASLTTDASGRFSTSLTPSRSLVVRVLHPGAPASTS